MLSKKALQEPERGGQGQRAGGGAGGGGDAVLRPFLVLGRRSLHARCDYEGLNACRSISRKEGNW